MRVLTPFEPTPEEREVAAQYAAPRWAWVILGVALFLVAAVEIPVILVLGPEHMLRIQTLNGSLVIAGGICVFAATCLLVMYPLKRLTIASFVAQRRFVEDARKLMEDEREKWRQDAAGLKTTFENVERHMAAIRAALERETAPLKIRRRDGHAPKDEGPDGVPEGQAARGADVPLPTHGSD